MSTGQIYLHAIGWTFVPIFLCGLAARDVVDQVRTFVRRKKAAQQKGAA